MNFSLERPTTLAEALNLLSVHGAQAALLAGGTDLMVRLKEKKIQPSWVIDLSRVTSLKYVVEEDDFIRIGSLATHSDVIESDAVRRSCSLLSMACGTVGSRQIRNMGTIAGNLGTASPAGDSIPALVALGASVGLVSGRGEREVLVEDFLTGPGKTGRQPDELIKEIIVPKMRSEERGYYNKLGQRNALAISIASVAVKIRFSAEAGVLGDAKVAFGALAPTVIRARRVEEALVNRRLDEKVIRDVAQLAWKEVVPISDIRASAEYRRDMAVSLLYQSLYHLLLDNKAIQ